MVIFVIMSWKELIIKEADYRVDYIVEEDHIRFLAFQYTDFYKGKLREKPSMAGTIHKFFQLHFNMTDVTFLRPEDGDKLAKLINRLYELRKEVFSEE
ncbi:MAG: hypothetical protein AAFQ94_09135 [Bacteroidota bacterium]